MRMTQKARFRAILFSITWCVSGIVYGQEVDVGQVGGGVCINSTPEESALILDDLFSDGLDFGQAFSGDIQSIAADLESSWYAQTNTVPIVVVDLGGEKSPIVSVRKGYPSVSSFIRHMNQQSSILRWRANAGVVYVGLSSGYLQKEVAVQRGEYRVCELLRSLSSQMRPNDPYPRGCLFVRPNYTWFSPDAYLDQKVSFARSLRAPLETILGMVLSQLSLRGGLTLMEMSPDGQTAPMFAIRQ